MNKPFTKHLILVSLSLLLLTIGSVSVKAAVRDTAVVPPFATSTYNNAFYNSVLEAAQGLAQPYLLQQGYISLPGVTVNGNNLVYNNDTFGIDESYNQSAAYYYVRDTQYAYYGVGAASKLWTTHIPDVMYDSVLQRFFSRSDCVGFGCRLLAAVGGTTSSNNAYLNLTKRVKNYGESTIAGKNSITTAYSIAIAFPEMTTAEIPGWQYIAGNAEDSMINAARGAGSTLNTYVGVRKGGFANCLPGDVLAFGYGPNATANGHFMIFDSVPKLLDSAGLQSFYPLVKGTKVRTSARKHHVYATSVIDDSGQFAHALDSRKNYSGIGHGVLLILTDTLDDAPVGFIFKPSKKDSAILYSPLKDTNNCYAISVGRYISSKQLPVSLVSFTAINQENKVHLSWNTASELNTNHFIIQRSADGTNYSNIGTVQAKGIGAESYQFSDASIINGTNYYRLQSIDKNGAISYSKVVNVQFTNSLNRFTVYPNPAKNVLTIAGEHIIKVQVLDNMGRVVNTQSLHDATNPLIKVDRFTSGVYHLKIQTTDGNSSTLGFIKQ